MGVTALKLQGKDRIAAFVLSPDRHGGVAVTTSRGRDVVVSERSYKLNSRGGKGTQIIQRGSITINPPEPQLWLRDESEG